MAARFFIILLVLIFSQKSEAQELNIDVQVKAPRLMNADPEVLETLEKQISEFLNQTKWTDDEFEDFEKIEGNLNITITEDVNPTTFAADFFIQTIRPIFKSNSKTQVLNLVDNSVQFQYTENQPLENSAQNYNDPLSSVLTYYAYMILAYDYDTFSSLGGDPYFTIAQNLVSAIPANAPNASSDWGTLGNKRNKYWMVENMMNPRVRPMRQAIYEYYIQSMDNMYEDIDRSKAVMVSSLNTILQVHQSYPNSAAVQMFADSKRLEIIEIFKGSSKGQQNKVYDIMVKIDPSQASEYNVLR